MIHKPTVLVLGAGASMPYGYPSGSALREMLVDQSTFDELIVGNLISRNDVGGFCERFLYSGMNSIDAFLSRIGSEQITPGGKTYLISYLPQERR